MGKLGGNGLRRKHAFQDPLERHRVGADGVAGEEIAGATPFAIGKLDIMVRVFTVEVDIERLKADPLPFLGVTLRLFDLTDNAGVH